MDAGGGRKQAMPARPKGVALRGKKVARPKGRPLRALRSGDGGEGLIEDADRDVSLLRAQDERR
jgi:hypothetical protein